MALLPDLSLWGIDEVERGVCEDTSANRRLLRENKSSWILVYTPDGRPTNLIQAVTPEMKEARLLANKSVLLEDRDDPDSDYITGYDLILHTPAQEVTPSWVIAATRHWNAVEEERERRGVNGKLYRPALGGPPARCRARRQDHKRCQNWANGMKDVDGLCKMHLNRKNGAEDNIGTNALVKARNRLISAAMEAVDGLEELSTSTTISENVRLGAINSLLDRAGLRAGFEIDQKVEVTVNSADEIVRKRIEQIANRLAEQREIEAQQQQEQEQELIAEVVEDDK